MSTESSLHTADTQLTSRCRVCGTEVSPAAFCGFCGAHLFRLPGDGPDWWRIRTYAAAPEEHVLRVSWVTTLFPQLTPRSRTAFRVGLAGLFAVLVSLALLRWQAALVAVSALGVPLLFVLYLRQVNASRDLRVRRLLVSALAGVALGSAWALLTGPLLANSTLKSTGMGNGESLLSWQRLAVPLVGAVLMAVPAAAVRLMSRSARESLDGYAIGSLGAVFYAAAATLTRTAPQLATGLVARDRPASALLVQAGINGVAMPATAAVAGGMIGTALWFTRRPGPAGRQSRPSRSPLLTALAVVSTVYVGLGLVDAARLRPGLQLGLYLLIATLAVVALRVGLHLALLHEWPDVTDGEPVVCPHCRHVVPDMAFCPNCGVAGRASSRSSRATRRAAGAQPLGDGQCSDDRLPMAVFPGYATPASAYTAPATGFASVTGLLGSLTVGLATAIAVAVAISINVTAPPVRYACPPYCARPPIGPPVDHEPEEHPGESQPPAALVPVHSHPRFTAADGSFSVAYFGAAKVTEHDGGVTLRYPGIDGEVRFFGTPAKNRTPLQIVQQYIAQRYPTAQIDYQIPNAMVGYEPGYGEVDDFTPADPNAAYIRGRLLVMTAVRNGLALMVAAEGPYVNFTPAITGHPSPANLMIANVIGYSVNSFTWNEEPPH